ncbi:MAG: hypothetical protein E7634_00400 [Ruminococcaceae bacterium]|nr:hypothetical protein [Oscillospiraceae bacterium]
MKKMINEIKKNALSYGSIPFWSWNDKLDPKELRRQIRNMHDMGINGFFMHARGGLETEYLSDDWFKCVKACIDEAEKLGMEAWSYDENGWPSGFAGGILLEDPDNHSVFLKHKFFETFPEDTDGIYALYAVCGKDKPVLTKAPIENAEKYLAVYYCTDSSYVDTLRGDITEKFIEHTHVEYQKRLGKTFGTSMPGFFTDEPQYYRYASPYSKFMEKWFEEDYGYSVFDAIPAIFCDFEGFEKYLYDYNKMIHVKFMENFAKKIYDWAEENGIMITGHGIEESSLAGQMACMGSIMPFYQYEHIPGIDYLGRGLQTPLSGKQLGSACQQLGKKKALSEMFACCGWDVSPTELKHIAELQYAGGVNIMCQHLYPYSERGQRKRDYPAHYSEHNPWQYKLREFDEYFNNLGYILSMGKEHADILVIHPIHTAWLTYRRHVGGSVANVENDFNQLFVKLSQHQLPYHFGEESMMNELASVKGDVFKVGKCSYKTVILPAVDTIDSNTLYLLKNFKENGGKIYTFKKHLPKYVDGKEIDACAFEFLNGCPDLADEEVFASLCGNCEYTLRGADGNNIPQINAMVRETKYGKVYYLTNLSNTEFKDTVFTVKGNSKLVSLDILTLEPKALRGRYNGENTEVLLDFEGSQAYVICEGEIPFDEFVSVPEKALIKLENKFVFNKLPENMMTLDRAEISFDGKEFSEERPIERIRDNLLTERFNGDIWLKFKFNSEFIPKKLSVVIEKPGILDVIVNGQPVEMGKKAWFDQYFKLTNIAPFTCVGENTVVLHLNYYQSDYVFHVINDNVMESLRNCLVFNTEIEAIYLLGSFEVKTDADAFKSEPNAAYRYPLSCGFALTEQKKSIDASNVVTDGYPFYCGKLEMKTTLDYRSGDATVLKLDGRFCVCDVTINGEFAGTVMFSKYLDLAPYLKEGKNEIVLTLCNSMRNLLGPHHCQNAEPYGISPKTFSFEKQWNGAECSAFVHDYSFVRFGIDVK